MRSGASTQNIKRTHLYDGYPSEPIWNQERNKSTHYDYRKDSQCTVPIRGKEVLKRELGL